MNSELKEQTNRFYLSVACIFSCDLVSNDSGNTLTISVLKCVLKQSTLLLDAFNKDRAALPQPLPNPPPLAPLPTVAPDARTQEMINEKLKKAEDLGKSKTNH